MDPEARLGRVADLALRRLRTFGYASTSFSDIADAACVPERELRKLFGDTDGLLAHLATPLVARLGEIRAAARPVDPSRPEELRRTVADLLDALLAHRLLVEVVLGDSTAGGTDAARAVRAAIVRIQQELGREPTAHVGPRIRAASAMGAIHAAVLELGDTDPTMVRSAIIDAAVAILLSSS